MENFEKDFKLFARDHNIPSLNIDDYTKSIRNYVEPTIIEERNLHATQISVYSRLFMERILFLSGEISEDMANVLNCQMLYLQMLNDKDITMYINSPGGSCTDGLAIYDVMNYIKPDVSTTCMGMAASMAAVLLSSGAKGKRHALPNSQFMIHQPSTGIGHIKADDLYIQAEEIKKCQDKLYNILAENSGKDFDTIKELCSHDKWYTAQEALDDGFIDNVIKRSK